jgi:integrase/recombinase XerD
LVDIFSEAELKRLLAAVPAASGLRSKIDADTLRTFVLLLYGAGLRRGEARRLKVPDVELPRSLLHIRGTKFFKTRTQATECNADRLPASRGTAGPAISLACTISGIRRWAGIMLCDECLQDRTQAGADGDDARDGGDLLFCKRDGTSLTDSAAVHRVTSWYRVGADLNDLLPKLATYLGHKDLSGTQRYLTMTEELLAEASRRFEVFAQGGRHD